MELLSYNFLSYERGYLANTSQVLKDPTHQFFFKIAFSPANDPQNTSRIFFHIKNPGKMTLKKVAGSKPLLMALNDLKNTFFQIF